MIEGGLFPIFQSVITKIDNSDSEGSVQEEEAKNISLLKMSKSYDKKIKELKETVNDLKKELNDIKGAKSSKVSVNESGDILIVKKGAKRWKINLPKDSISLAPVDLGSTDTDDLEQDKRDDRRSEVINSLKSLTGK